MATNKDSTHSNTGGSGGVTYPDLNVTNAMMASMTECLTLQQSLLSVPYFDGKNVPLRDYIQNIRGGFAYVPPASEKVYVRAVIGKLQGQARDSIHGKDIDTVDALIKHLKTRFAPIKTYPQYQHEIENIRMHRDESVYAFHDRLMILIGGARNALEDAHGGRDVEAMLIPIKDCALEAFLRGLPDDIARAVDARDPKDLETAVQHAVRIESRMRSGVIPSSESTRLFISRTGVDRNLEHTISRDPSPIDRNRAGSSRALNTQPGILRPVPSENARPYYPPHHYYPPISYCYPPMPYPPYGPPHPYDRHYPQNYPNYQSQRSASPENRHYSSRSPERNREWEQRSPASYRENSPNNNSHNSTASHWQSSKKLEDLNSRGAHRTDAPGSPTNAKRHATVRFLEKDQ